MKLARSAYEANRSGARRRACLVTSVAFSIERRLQRVVENRIVRAIDEIGEDNLVFLGEAQRPSRKINPRAQRRGVRWGSSDSSCADEGRPRKTGGLKTAAAVSNYPARVRCSVSLGGVT